MVLFMRSSLLVSLLVLAARVSLSAATQELDQDSYAALIKSGKNGMIKFFQPWCGHCTKMKPAWDEASAAAHSSVFLADVNCSDQEELCKEVGVSGYPTIKVYKDGEVSDYNGGRTLEDLTKYVETELATPCDITKLAETCSEKAAPYTEKWKAKDVEAIKKELGRLYGLAGKSMTADLKAWLRERVAILNQLAPAESAETPEL
jgi:protein disulfide-isomerase-like protein